MKSKHLGKETHYRLEKYSPSFLDAVKRNSPDQAKKIFGHDYWNAYEFSYLNINSQPALESLEIKIPMTSINTVESKSLKYLIQAKIYLRIRYKIIIVIVPKNIPDIT